MSHIFPETELIVTDKKTVYHIDLSPDQIADDVIVVGDQGRVEKISAFFSKIECKVAHREFVTHTGLFNGKRISVVSTGIGTDNIDIVINELDALVNIDLAKKTIKETHTSLNIIRLGTSGALQEDIAVDSFMVSEYAMGFDGVMGFYDAKFDEKMDTNEYLMCFSNGVVDFQNKVFRDGHPQDYITKTTKIPYIPFETLDPQNEIIQNILDFMEQLFPNKSLNKY